MIVVYVGTVAFISPSSPSNLITRSGFKNLVFCVLSDSAFVFAWVC